MKFDELDDRMRVFETAHDLCVLPGLYMVARMDGRSFARLTKEAHQFEAPFDARFRDLMLDTAEHLMTDCGFNIVYAYTQSDEISLLFALAENSFRRKLRKLISVLSGEASAKFSLLLGAVAVFDCRISQLPSVDLVVDYFRWRNEDARRNALNAHGYWLLRKRGQTVGQATAAMEGLSVAQKNELLFQNGVNFNDLPLWQKRGSGLWIKPHCPEENGLIERLHRTLRGELEGEDLKNLLEAKKVFARIVRRYNEERLHSALGYLTPADYYRGNPGARYAARRAKLSQARHQRRERNLEMQQRTLPFPGGEEVASD